MPLRTKGGLFYLDLSDGLPPAQTMTAKATGSGVSYVEMFAGRGAMAKAAQNCGGNVVLLVENEEVAVDNLQRDSSTSTTFSSSGTRCYKGPERHPAAVLVAHRHEVAPTTPPRTRRRRGRGGDPGERPGPGGHLPPPNSQDKQQEHWGKVHCHQGAVLGIGL